MFQRRCNFRFYNLYARCSSTKKVTLIGSSLRDKLLLQSLDFVTKITDNPLLFPAQCVGVRAEETRGCGSISTLMASKCWTFLIRCYMEAVRPLFPWVYVGTCRKKPVRYYYRGANKLQRKFSADLLLHNPYPRRIFHARTVLDIYVQVEYDLSYHKMALDEKGILPETKKNVVRRFINGYYYPVI